MWAARCVLRICWFRVYPHSFGRRDYRGSFARSNRYLKYDPQLDGYIVQLPLPKYIDEEKILLAIDPKKDVDGSTPQTLDVWL